MNSPDAIKWLDAIIAELRELFDRGTFRQIDREKGGNTYSRAIKSKFVFTIKPDGTFKARLVACGYAQVQGRDYNETYAPSAMFKTLCTVLHIAAMKQWNICTADISNENLESKIDYKVTMDLPTGLRDMINPDLSTVEVEGALYGLKQAGRLWNQHFTRILKAYGQSDGFIL